MPMIRHAILLLIAPTLWAAEKVSYNKHIRPILSDKCFTCHGPDANKREADLRLDIREEAIKAEAILPGKPELSELITRIHETNPKEVMPPPKSPRQLTDADRKMLELWIAQGADYEPLWSFTPLPASVPVPANSTWAVNEIDRFIGVRLDLEKLKAATPAAPERWLRRVTFDLTGLPPEAKDLETFLADKSPEARARVVDRLLASPRFGEKMAVDWLDVARYADSFGYQSDIDTHAWPYRDWVISAFNQNLPWDQFITWQLAGDLLPNPTREQLVATAFNRIHRKTQEGGSIEAEFRQEGISDRVHTVGTAFMGLTFECTRCHDHKYDPLTMKDYYSLGAFFNSIDEWGLLHGNGSIQPSPTLFLTNEAQDKAIADKTNAITTAEKALVELAATRESAFQAWLAAPSANIVDLSGSYDLDVADKDGFVNAVDPKRPGKSNDKNKIVPGHRGQALSFTGDDPLDLGKHNFTNREDSITVSFWLKPGGVTKRTLVFHDSEGADPGFNGFELLYEDGRLRWMVAREWPGNCIAIRSKDIVPAGQWTHITVSYDGSSKAAGLKIFLNGSTTPCEVVRDQLTGNSGSGKGITFGERFRDSGLLNGAVDDIRIHPRAVSPLEVKSLHADKPLTEIIAATPRDEAGLAELRGYYLSAVDAETRQALANLKNLRRSLRETIDRIPELPVMKEMAQPRSAHILDRGAYDLPVGDPLARATPAALPPFPKDQPLDRLGFARWLTAPDHPLTARVQVNRVWQHFFGRGLVSTSENFGSQGEAPSHPELLDWLARDFVSKGWDFKNLCRQIVLSATYSQDSKVSKELRDRDPANILLARGPAKRLSGEELRDQALALSGLLHPDIGGPPAKPYLPDSASWKVLNNFVPEYKRDAAPGIYRRSLYGFWRRTAPPPGMIAFDVPGRDVCSVRRQQTNTPLQPLVMLNDPQFVEASRGLAIRMMNQPGALTEKIRWLFLETLDRNPDENEMRLLVELHNEQLEIFRKDTSQADSYLKVGDMKAPAGLPAVDLAAATVLANAVINLDEAITLR
jgi:hypothetical protein